MIFRTQIRIPEEDWDKLKQRPFNIYLKRNKKLNGKLDAIKIRLAELITQKREEKKNPLQRVLSSEIREICNNNQIETPENTLIYYMEWYIDSRQEMIRPSTYKRYKVFYHLLKRFEGFMLKRLYIDAVNADFINDFVSFGREEEYSENTIYRTIHFVKTILNFVERKGIRTAVRELEIRREKQQKEVVTLTEEEIIKIKNTPVPEELQAAKDWLLISCYTGQRFSDFMQFNTDQLKDINGKTCISFVQQKTKKKILLPLHPTVMDTLQKNNNEFPRCMTNQQYNEQIKQIAKLAYLDELIKARKRIGYRTRDVATKKWDIISSHIGRRSFATNFYGKIPTALLMEATGHSTEQMFLKYINPIDNERILCLSSYFDKVHAERMR